MITKVLIRLYDKDKNLRFTEEKEIEVNSSWYTAQNYFDENLKERLLDDEDDIWSVILRWNNKNYEFKRKINGDQCRKKGRKKRTPRHQ